MTLGLWNKLLCGWADFSCTVSVNEEGMTEKFKLIQKEISNLKLPDGQFGEQILIWVNVPCRDEKTINKQAIAT